MHTFVHFTKKISKLEKYKHNWKIKAMHVAEILLPGHLTKITIQYKEPSLTRSYGSWIYKIVARSTRYSFIRQSMLVT